MNGTIWTAANQFAKALSTNATDSSFASKIPTTTEPTNDGVIDLSKTPAGKIPNQLLICPYGVGSENTTFDMRWLGWRLVGTLWVPVPLMQFSCTLSTAVGVAGATVVATERFVDIMTASIGTSGVSYELVSVGDTYANLVAHAVIDAKGFAKLEVQFDMTGATSGNCLYAGL